MAHKKMQDTKYSNKTTKATRITKEDTGVLSSIQQTADRNDGTIKKLPGVRTDEKNFNLVVDGVPYLVKSIPILFNDELRFRVIINNDTEHLFTWDSQIKMLRAIDDDAADLPDRLEEAINQKLQSQLR